MKFEDNIFQLLEYLNTSKFFNVSFILIGNNTCKINDIYLKKFKYFRGTKLNELTELES